MLSWSTAWQLWGHEGCVPPHHPGCHIPWMKIALGFLPILSTKSAQAPYVTQFLNPSTWLGKIQKTSLSASYWNTEHVLYNPPPTFFFSFSVKGRKEDYCLWLWLRKLLNRKNKNLLKRKSKQCNKNFHSLISKSSMESKPLVFCSSWRALRN